MRYLGIDIGGSSTKLAVLEEGRVIWSSQSPRYERPSRHELIEGIRVAGAGRDTRAVGVGLCVPGILDEAGRAVALSVNVPGLNGLNLDDLVRLAFDQTPGRLRIVTDALAAAYDIWSTRDLPGRLLVLSLGTGIGAAVLDDGKPLMVDGPTPGHIGQVDVSLPGEAVIGPDGGAGSLEGYVGAGALRSRFGDDLAVVLPVLRGGEAPFRALARAVRIAHAIYRPHHVVLAGGIGIRLAHVLGRLRELIETDLSSVARRGWTLSTGESDFHAAAGAARLAASGGSDG